MHIEFPKNVMVQTTSYCNASCIFCPYMQVKKELPQGEMSWEIYKKIVDECSNHKVERILPYLMNEPLMDEDIIKKIDYTKEKNTSASVHILTNGSLLTQKMTASLIESKLDWIGISFHGIQKETYEGTMGLNFEKTLENVCNFIEAAEEDRDSDFIMITFLKSRNLSDREKDKAIDFWKSKGIHRISYCEGPISRAGNVKNLPKVRHNSIAGCKSIWTNEMIHILYNGDVVLCCMDWRREVVLGNVNEQTISDIWRGDIYQTIRKMIRDERKSPENFICKRCEESIQ